MLDSLEVFKQVASLSVYLEHGNMQNPANSSTHRLLQQPACCFLPSNRTAPLCHSLDLELRHHPAEHLIHCIQAAAALLAATLQRKQLLHCSLACVDRALALAAAGCSWSGRLDGLQPLSLRAEQHQLAVVLLDVALRIAEESQAHLAQRLGAILTDGAGGQTRTRCPCCLCNAGGCNQTLPASVSSSVQNDLTGSAWLTTHTGLCDICISMPACMCLDIAAAAALGTSPGQESCLVHASCVLQDSPCRRCC